jgi:hypothetical protein
MRLCYRWFAYAVVELVLAMTTCDRRLGKVVKSNSHCDYVVQLDDDLEVTNPPQPDEYGFGSFVKLESDSRHWAVGLIYDSQILNPQFASQGPRLSSEPDPVFTPDLIYETRTLLSTVLVGTLTPNGGKTYGIQGIPRVVVPVNTVVYRMTTEDIHTFHLNALKQPQFCYYGHLLNAGGSFATDLAQQVLQELIDSHLFSGADQRALEILCRELTWKSTMSPIR